MEVQLKYRQTIPNFTGVYIPLPALTLLFQGHLRFHALRIAAIGGVSWTLLNRLPGNKRSKSQC